MGSNNFDCKIVTIGKGNKQIACCYLKKVLVINLILDWCHISHSIFTFLPVAMVTGAAQPYLSSAHHWTVCQLS